MLNANECYAILQVRQDASPEEIKRAFRLRAKQLHPDQNNSADAHEQFIRLHEAYELLSRGRVLPKEKIVTAREADILRTRKAAANYARMKYEEYVRETEMYHTSPYAWIFKILYYGLFFIYLFCAMVFASIPIVLFTYGIQWFLLSCPLWVLCYFTFVYAYQWKKEIDPLFN